MDEGTIKRVTNKMYVSLQIEEKLPLEKYEIYIKPAFNSASWRFYQGKHQLVIGTLIFKKMTQNTTPKDKLLYLRSYLYHELAHSIWTDKDLKAIDKKLKKLKFSFYMYNLFEDARIEEKMRTHLKKNFNWLKYEKVSEIDNPVNIFFYLIQAEHNPKAIEFIESKLNFMVKEHFESVQLFYKKAIVCESHEEIIDLLKKWYAKFPNTQKYKEQNSIKPHLFIMESFYTLDEGEFNNLIKGLQNSLTIDETQNKNIKKIKAKKSNKSSLLSATLHKVTFEKRLRDNLLSKMKKLFLSPKRVSASIIPSKKLHIKNIVKRSEKIFKRKSRDRFVKRKITIVLDMSGSMYETMESMRLVVDVLDNMAKNNIIDATLILSGVLNGKFLYETLTMPLEEDILERIVPCFEAEGLHSSMSANLELLKKSDYVWVLTDGMICEGPLDKNFYTKHHIKLHAFYIGEMIYKKEMEISFDYVICEENVKNLTDKIFLLIK